MKISVGFSPCPNDTFIFDAWVNRKIAFGDLDLDIYLEDVQTLNEWALAGKLDVSKISYGVLPLIANNYSVLNSGGALGKGVGPLLISKHLPNTTNFEALQELVARTKVVIPGENTTAHLLFSLAFNTTEQKIFLPFHEIENHLLNNPTHAGVIIHENRFTYQHKGLQLWQDLGNYWENQLHTPIPLGGIVAKKSLPAKVVAYLNNCIRESLAHARQYHSHQLSPYVIEHAQEMSETVMKQHIQLYVNEFSDHLGIEGRKAIITLMKVYQQLHQLPYSNLNLFAEDEFLPKKC
jgi:1,4-dihydroxy-6-naphthoate synthase